MNQALTTARNLALDLASIPADPWRPDGGKVYLQQLQALLMPDESRNDPAPSRWFALGDPQAPLSRVLQTLDAHALLTESGRLDPSVGLISMGDHFDYPPSQDEPAPDPAHATLAWLAAHPASQVLLLLGNHDAFRVQEFMGLSQALWPQVRSLAHEAASNPPAEEDLARLAPGLPTATMLTKDCASFEPSQTDQTAALLAAGRFRLAAAGRFAGRPLLLTHAGLTLRETELLKVPAQAVPLAEALNAFLKDATDHVCPHWEKGARIPLDLLPLHAAGMAGSEGGGLLYHRPWNPEDTRDDPVWVKSGPAPRRFDPRTLPPGLEQAAGHIGHAKCSKTLGFWIPPEAQNPPHGGLRTLLVEHGGDVRYARSLQSHTPARSRLYLLDPDLWRLSPGETAPLLPLEAVFPA